MGNNTKPGRGNTGTGCFGANSRSASAGVGGGSVLAHELQQVLDVTVDLDLGVDLRDSAGAVVPTIPTPTSAPDAPIVGEVRIAAGENPGSWLSIKQDGIEVFAKTLSQGQSFALRAQRAVLIKAGNSGVVTVIINGKELCCAGSRNGEVRTVSWPP